MILLQKAHHGEDKSGGAKTLMYVIMSDGTPIVYQEYFPKDCDEADI